jgi:hypothetical protein
MSKALAIALMFWCAGTGCMMVSYARADMSDMESAARAADQPMAGMHAAMDAHGCCKATHKSAKRTKAAHHSIDFAGAQFTVPPVQTDAMSCCPLTSGLIVVASRSQSNDSGSALTETDSSSLALSKSDHTPVAVPLRLPNRAHSYLLDCAFLI